MRLIALIAGKDLREFWRDGRLSWMCGLVLILLVTSLALGWRQQRHASVERETAQHASYDNWLDQQGKNPHVAAHYGMYVFKPTPRLAVFDPGLNPYLGTAVYLEAHIQNEFKFRPADDSTGLLQFGGLSAAWVMQVLAPLLIVALGFNAFAGERERGTLRQVLSSGVAASQLLWGKALAIGAAMGLYLIPAAVAGLILIGTGSAPGDLSEDLARFSAIGVGYGIYLAIFIFLTLAVSAWASSARMALLILLAVWTVNTMIAPRAVADLARQMYPLTSLGELDNAVETDRRRAINKMLKETYKVDLLKQLPDRVLGQSLQTNDEISFPILEHHWGALGVSLEKHQRLQEWSGLVTPLLAMRSFSMGMAGTDFACHRDFSSAAEQYRRVISRTMNQDIMAHAGDLGEYRADPALWKKVPAFEYRRPSFAWSLARHWQSLAILAVGLAVSLVLALGSVGHLRGAMGASTGRDSRTFVAGRMRRFRPWSLGCFSAGTPAGIVFGHEWRLLTADRTLWIVAGLAVGLTGYGLYNGLQRTQQKEQSLAAVLEEHDARMARLLSRLPNILAGIEEPDFILNPADPVWASGGWAGGAARYAYLPATSLAPVALGQADLLPHYFRVTSRDQTNFIQQSTIESPW